MPHYFFHVHDGEDYPDHEGIGLDSAKAARQEAVVAAGRMLAENGRKFWDNGIWAMTVTDELGLTDCELKFSATS